MPDHPYQDDQTISNDVLLLRRVPCLPNINIVWDGNQECWRPSSASFEDHPNGTPMSIALSDVLAQLGRNYESVLEAVEGEFALVGFTAEVARANGQGVAREPTPEEPAHGVVFGDKPKRVRRAIAKNSRWIVSPDSYV